MEQLVPIGIALVFIGFILIAVGSVSQSKGDVHVGFGGFIGPIPFGWATSKPMLCAVIGIVFVMAVLWALRVFG